MVTITARPCPKCPAWMILYHTGVIASSDSPMLLMEWWCGCGHRERAEPSVVATIPDDRVGWWQAVNRQGEREEAAQHTTGQSWAWRLFRYLGLVS